MSTPVPDERVRISSAEAIPLAYALTARIAADQGIRLIGIKGVSLAHHGLRDPRISADIDMLLHPDDKDRFVAAMEAAGWRVAADVTVPRFLGQHSVNLLNDHWPIGIDLHVYFPGFLAPAGEVFELLWERRVDLPQAGCPVFFTDLASSAAVAALHYLRAPGQPSNDTAYEALVAKAKVRLEDADLRDLVALATATGALAPLVPFLNRLGAAFSLPSPEAYPDEMRRWELGTQAHPFLAWADEFRTLGPRQWPGFLWNMVWLSPDELRAYHGDHTETTPLWRLRLQRVQRVLKAMPGVLRHELDRRRRRT